MIAIISFAMHNLFQVYFLEFNRGNKNAKYFMGTD